MARPDGRASARKSFVLMVAGIMILFLCSVSSAVVPDRIKYQGKLTTASGGCFNDTVQMTFSIYSDDQGTVQDWTETQNSVIVKEGFFNVLLGSVDSIPSSVFDGNIKYLGVQVESDPEMRPLKPMVSVAYAYRAGTTDGGAVNCEDCDTVFVNVVGPDSVVATTGSAFLGKASGSSTDALLGVTGYAKNSSSGAAYGGSFEADSSGTGTHYGVVSSALGSSSLYNYGAWCWADADASGTATGGVFIALGSGSGFYRGVFAQAFVTTPDPAQGVYALCSNHSIAPAYGGYFYANDAGTGTHYGSYSIGSGSSSSSTYGCRGQAGNSSSGNVYAGYFSAATTGSGTKYGVYASAPADQGWAGYFEGDVRITDSLVVLGAKSAGVKVDNGEYRLLYSQESPEVWFEDFGEGQLVNGTTHIDLDPLFLETVTLNSQHPMKVFIQLTSGEPMNVVVHKGITGFDIVAEDISSNATFDYRVVAKRKGYENIRLSKMGGPTPEQVAAEQERHLAELEVERARMEQERMEMEREAELR